MDHSAVIKTAPRFCKKAATGLLYGRAGHILSASVSQYSLDSYYNF